MKRNNWYWVLAILALVILLALLWRACAAKPDGSSGSLDPMDHSQMDSSQLEPGLQRYQQEQDAIMQLMMDEMGGIEHSGSAAVDFLAGMIPHHESAIAMAQSYLDNGGSHPELKPLAESIITAQKAEIEEMNAMLEQLKTTAVKDEEQEKAYWADYNKLMLESHAAHMEGSSLDEAFARGMMVHHQMAVDMADAILVHTGEKNVEQLAQTIVDTQKQEIADMQAVLDGLGASSASH